MRSLYPNLVLRDLIQEWTVKHAHLLDPDIVFRVTNDSDCAKDIPRQPHIQGNAANCARLRTSCSSPVLAAVPHACGVVAVPAPALHACERTPLRANVSHSCGSAGRMGLQDDVTPNADDNVRSPIRAWPCGRATTSSCTASVHDTQVTHVMQVTPRCGSLRASSIDGEGSSPLLAWPPDPGSRTGSLDGVVAGGRACTTRNALFLNQEQGHGCDSTCREGVVTAEHGVDSQAGGREERAGTRATLEVVSEPQPHVAELVEVYGGGGRSPFSCRSTRGLVDKSRGQSRRD
jgi:hypothetical protein